MGFKVTLDREAIGVPKVQKVSARRKAGDHVRLMPPGTLVCLHCGQQYALTLPVPIPVMTGAMKGFGGVHKKCPVGERGRACGWCLEFGHKPDVCPAREYGGDPYRWAQGPDTGLSSLAIWNTLMGTAATATHVPLDADDFGRCHRLLHAIPGWRSRICEMLVVPGWAPLVVSWDLIEDRFLAKDYAGVCRLLDGLNGGGA